MHVKCRAYFQKAGYGVRNSTFPHAAGLFEERLQSKLHKEDQVVEWTTQNNVTCNTQWTHKYKLRATTQRQRV